MPLVKNAGLQSSSSSGEYSGCKKPPSRALTLIEVGKASMTYHAPKDGPKAAFDWLTIDFRIYGLATAKSLNINLTARSAPILPRTACQHYKS